MARRRTGARGCGIRGDGASLSVVTDDASNPTAPDADDVPTSPGSAPAANRRRRLIVAIAAAVALVVLLVCACAGALAAGVGRLAREVDRARETHSRLDAACRDLEKRLNRLTPPGAAATPGRRATAIRNENAALQPFLSEIEQLPHRRGRDDDDDDRRARLADGWRQLLDARSRYADALDRQAANGEPAFFVVPRDRHGRSVTDRLRNAPPECAAAARRLAAPDL